MKTPAELAQATVNDNAIPFIVVSEHFQRTARVPFIAKDAFKKKFRGAKWDKVNSRWILSKPLTKAQQRFVDEFNAAANEIVKPMLSDKALEKWSSLEILGEGFTLHGQSLSTNIEHFEKFYGNK